MNGEVGPGERIGTQLELEKRFEVSKITVRKAIEVLEKEGIVITVHGKGTYVKHAKVEQTLDELQSLTAIIKKSGYQPKVKVVSLETVATVEAFLENNDRPDDTYCKYIERLHTVEDKPIALACVYIPYGIGEQLTEEELEKFSIYELLENKLDLKIGEAVQTIESLPANEEIGQLLKVPKNFPLLKAERLTYSEENEILEKITFFYPFNEYAFRIKLKRASKMPMWPSILS